MNKLRELTRKQIIMCFAVATVVATAAIFAVYKFGCRHTYPSELVAIDSLCESDPDSASVLIKKIHAKTYSGDDEWYFRLLKIKQKVKSGERFDTAKEADALVGHFKNSSDKGLSLQAIYCVGCVYASLGDTPQALELFQDALDCIGDDTAYDNIKALCLYRLGYHLSMQGLDREAIPWQLKALAIHKEMKALEKCVYDYEDLAWSYHSTGNLKAAERCLNEAWRLALKLKKEGVVSEVASQFTSYYNATGDLRKARHFADIALRNPRRYSVNAAYSLALKVYSKLGDGSKASALCDSTLKYGNVFGKRYAYRWLTERELLRKNVASAEKCFSNYKLYVDSAEALSPVQASANSDAMYNYALRKEKNARLEKENAAKRMYIMVILSVSVVLVLSLTVMYLLKSKRKKELEERVELLKASLEKAEMLEDGVLRQKTLELEELKEQLKRQGGSDTATAELEKAVSEHEDSVASINRTRRIQRAANCEMVETAVYKAMADTVKSDGTNGFQDWSLLAETVCGVYPQFKESILKLRKMSDIEYKVCLSLKAGFSIQDAALLVCRSQDTVYSICRRLYKKNFDDSPSAKKWKMFIQAL